MVELERKLLGLKKEDYLFIQSTDERNNVAYFGKFSRIGQGMDHSLNIRLGYKFELKKNLSTNVWEPSKCRGLVKIPINELQNGKYKLYVGPSKISECMNSAKNYNFNLVDAIIANCGS